MFEGEGDLLRGDAGGFEGGAEAIRVFRGISEGGGGGFRGQVHFAVVGDGHEDLSARGRGAAVPEEALFPCEVEERHGIAVALAAGDAGADGEAVGEGGFFGVAGGAGDGAVAGEPGVVEELAAEIDAFGDERVVAGEIGDGEGTADG